MIQCLNIKTLEIHYLPASAISQLAEADASLELILYRKREMILPSSGV